MLSNSPTEKRDAKGSEEQLHESLKALKTDYFDIYQFYGLDNPDEIKTVFASGGAMETMMKAKDRGLIRNIGFTCHTEEGAFEIMISSNGQDSRKSRSTGYGTRSLR